MATYRVGKIKKSLSPHEEVALSLYHLGGFDAMRRPGAHWVDSKTVAALMKKGIFDKHGLTELGTSYVADLLRKYPSGLPMSLKETF